MKHPTDGGVITTEGHGDPIKDDIGVDTSAIGFPTGGS